MVNDSMAADRLEKLERYLREDPNNLPLLEDAYQMACAAGEWDRARFHLRHAAALGVTGPGVEFRESRIDLALHRWVEARTRLELLQAAGGMSAEAADAIAHDMAYATFRQGDFAAARELLASRVEAPPVAPVYQALWLRVLHHSGDIEGAVDWAQARYAKQELTSEAGGIASLAALDLGRMDIAKVWASRALEENPKLLEPLVTRGTVALAEGDPAFAEAVLREALSVHPEDGRAWSAMGFVHLLMQRIDDALFDFHRAVQFMPTHVGTWNGLGWTNVFRRDMQAAAQAFEKALELDRNFGESHGGLAVAYAFQGNSVLAKEAIARANGLDKDNLASHYAQAVLSGDVRDTEAIRRLAMRLLARRAAPAGGSMADWIQPVMAAVQATEQGSQQARIVE